MPTEKPVFTKEAEDLIFNAARLQVLHTVLWRGTGRKAPDFKTLLGEWGNTSVLGTFVSFKKDGQLRSCMGWMNDGAPLAGALQSSATSAAQEDPRFPPLSASEFPRLTMEVWVLWGMEEVPETGEARLGTFEIGRHGLQIHYGGRRGLLLPGVAVEYNMTPLQFLEATCQKAGLPRDAWKDPRTVLYRFEGVAIDREFYDDSVAAKVSEAERNGTGSDNRYDVRNFGWNFGRLVAPAALTASKAPSASPSASSSALTSEYPAVRPAAVAGMFYPNGRQQTAALDLFAKNAEETNPEGAKVRVSAALVPHAGWIYSGQLCFNVLAGIEIPSTVLVLAPKHRPEGLSWAVSPSREWDYGTGRLENDMDLMEGLLKAVPRFKPDVVSHRREHSIEVILPMIARLAPNAKVVGAVFGFGSEGDLFKGAEQFADFYGKLETPPLLLVSSDMNHYESEERTQELDGLAMDAMETLDARKLYTTVERNQITMCGVQPASFVLAALAQCGLLHSYKKIGHTTSGKASGDYAHVVGYAGYTFS